MLESMLINYKSNAWKKGKERLAHNRIVPNYIRLPIWHYVRERENKKKKKRLGDDRAFKRHIQTSQKFHS